jgi:hypothetical protein
MQSEKQRPTRLTMLFVTVNGKQLGYSNETATVTETATLLALMAKEKQARCPYTLFHRSLGSRIRNAPEEKHSDSDK